MSEEPGRPYNYYNYFTEVEEAFVRRRGAHLLVSPLDWALIESWKDIGVPLHIVLRGIERALDKFDAQPHRHRRVNTLFYCQQEVESSYAEYRRALVGSAEADPDAARAEPQPESAANPFPRSRVERHLEAAAAELAEARRRASAAGLAGVAEAVARSEGRLAEILASLAASSVLDGEGLERDLTSLEDLLLAALVEHAPPEELEAERAAAKAQLKSYKRGMDKEVYQQTFDKLVARRLREIHHVPRLSLFFME
jgi:hypothetical protein